MGGNWIHLDDRPRTAVYVVPRTEDDDALGEAGQDRRVGLGDNDLEHGRN